MNPTALSLRGEILSSEFFLSAQAARGRQELFAKSEENK